MTRLRLAALATAAAFSAGLLAPSVALAAPPVAGNDAYTTDEDVVLDVGAPGVLDNDSDPDLAPVTAENASDPAHGTVTLDPDGSFSYQPDPNWNGTDAFTYQATAEGESTTATVTITVNAVNDAPTAGPDSYSVNEDGVLNVNTQNDVLGNDSDIEGSNLTSVSFTQPANGTVDNTGTNGTFRYTPDPNFNGTDTFTYRASDGSAQSAPQTVTITVNAVNDTPVAAADSYSTPEDTQLVVAAPGVLGNDSDVDGQSLTAAVVTAPAHGSLDLASNGGFTFTPTANYNGPDSFTYRASDGTAFSNTVTVSLTITAVADAPTAVDDSGSTNEDVALVVAAPGVLGNDVDPEGGGLTATVVATPAHGTLSLNANGGYTYTPTANYNGPDSFTYRANAGSTPSNTATVSLTVNAVNDAPVAVNDSGNGIEDTPLVVTAPGVLGNDSDIEGSGLTAAIQTQPANGSLALNANGSYTYTPNANFAGADSFTYRASDGSLQSNIATVNLTIANVNDPPVATADSRTTNEDTVLNAATVLGNDSDPDTGTTLTAVLDAGPATGALTLNANGTFTYTPVANASGTVTFTYHASDGSLSSNVVTVTITITPVNDAPVAVADIGSTAEDTQLVVATPGLRANDSDVETAQASLVASIVSQPAHGAAVVNANGSYTYTPAANYFGADSFTYRVFDGALYSAPATVSLTVTAVNDAPVADTDAYPATEDVALVVAAASGVLIGDTDVDSATLTAIVDVQPTHGTLSLQATGAFTYTPAANYNGPDTFSYHASDGTLSSAITQVTLTVGAVNDAPTFVLGTNPSVMEDAPLQTIANFLTAVSPGPTDEAAQTTTLQPLVVASPLLFAVQPSISAAGTLTFRPATNRSGSSLVTVNVTDNGGTTNGGDDTGTQTFTITVVGSNDPPIATDDPDDADAYLVEAGITTPLDVLANDTTLPDVGETMTIVSATKPGHGTVTIAAGGSGLSYRSTTGFVGADTFRYTISDGTSTATADVYVSVADTLAPTLGTATFRFDTGAKLTSTVKVILGWSASDPGSGVKSYDVQQSLDGGAHWTSFLSGTTATSTTRSHARNIAYTYRFRARDKGNRLSGWSAPTTFTPRRYQESTALASYSSGWKTASIDTASGNHTRYSRTRGATSTFTFTGRAVSLVAPRGSTRGKAEIRVDGVLVKTVSLYRATLDPRRHVWSRSWTTVGPHVVSVRVLGTSGHPRFDIDAWTVLE